MDMDEMIQACKDKQTDNEEIVFAVGAGRIAPMLGKMKQQKQAFKFIRSLDGFLGVHPIDMWHTMLIFDTLNNAKGGRNLMRTKDIPVGEIVPILIPKEYARKKT